MKSKLEPRQDTRRQRKQISTYPADWAWELLGGGASTVATAAVECWAAALAAATLDNEEALEPSHWKALADWLGNRSVHDVVDHKVREPGAALAAALRGGWHDSAACEATAKLFEDVDYVHMWAMLWALDWKQRSNAEGEWWTLAARLK